MSRASSRLCSRCGAGSVKVLRGPRDLLCRSSPVRIFYRPRPSLRKPSPWHEPPPHFLSCLTSTVVCLACRGWLGKSTPEVCHLRCWRARGGGFCLVPKDLEKTGVFSNSYARLAWSALVRPGVLICCGVLWYTAASLVGLVLVSGESSFYPSVCGGLCRGVGFGR